MATDLQAEGTAPRFKEHKLATKKNSKDSPITYTRFERARILGARALQISLGAPILADVPQTVIDPLSIAEAEYDAGVIPITVIHESAAES